MLTSGKLGAALALFLTVAALAAASARADDPRWEFPAGSKVTGTLSGGDSHLFGVRLVAGTSYDVTLTGKKGFVPRLDFLDESRTPVPTDGVLVQSGSKTTLTHFMVTRTGTYLLRVTGASPGVYQLTTKGKPSKGGSQTAAIASAGATAQVRFHATTGGSATIAVKPAKGSGAHPLVLGVTDPQGADVPLDARRTSSRSDACKVACGTSGAYLVTVGAADATTGELTVTIKVATKKEPYSSLKKVDPGTRAPDFAYFAANIQPVFQNRGCNSTSCHGAVSGQGRMILKGPAQGPFTLEETYWNYFRLSEWVEVGNPESRALLKPLYIEDGGIYHGGGDVFRKADPEYQPFLDWCMGSSIPSIPPVADAGADVHGYVGNAATIDGTASSDVERQALTHQWTLLSAPGGSAATIANSSSSQPTLTPDRSGVYLCSLVVTDASGVASPPDQVAIAADANSQAGVITFEAEHGAISGSFAVTDDVRASNGKLISRLPGAAQDGVAAYLFSLDTPGDYAIWGRVLSTSNLHDALAVRMDGGPVRTWETPVVGDWSFARANDRMNRRRLVTGSSVLDVIAGGTWFNMRAESVDVRGVALTGSRMQFGTIDARMRFDTKLTGYVRNAQVVFDWLDERNYLFAGMDDSGNRIYIGSVADGLRTNHVSFSTTINSNQNYLFRAVIDADGTVHAFVDGTERASYRFDPAVRGVKGGVAGVMVERTTNSMGTGWIDDLVLTDSAEGEVWRDDFQTTPWTDPLIVTLGAGQHQLEVLAGETGVKLDRIVVALSSLDPTDAVAQTRLVRRIYFDAANRSPTNDELILAPFLTTDGVAQELVHAYSYYQGWYESRLVQHRLTGLDSPKTNDADYQSLSSIPARLTNGAITEIQAMGEIAKSAAWARLNADSRDFAYSLFEEFLNRKPLTQAPSGGRSESSAAQNIYNGTSTALFGEMGATPTDLVDIVLGLNGRRPNYNGNKPGNLAPDTQELHRAQIQMTWTRLVPATAIAAADLATWTAQFVADPAAIRGTVAAIMQSGAYASDAATPRSKTTRQLIRGLYVDVLGRNPDLDTVGNLEYSFVSSGDPVPLANELVQQMLRSPDANPATPPVAGLDADAWIDTTFVRTLGRLPTATEHADLENFLLTSAITTTDLTLEAILTSQEYLYY